MNYHFEDAIFINVFSRLANYVLHDLIDLSEGDFDAILRKNVVLKILFSENILTCLHWSSVSLPAIHSFKITLSFLDSFKQL